MSNFGTCDDWWLSTKSPATMFRPAYQTKEMDAYLRETAGIDTAILAVDIGMSPLHIEACQRRLGLRKITGNQRKAKRTNPED